MKIDLLKDRGLLAKAHFVVTKQIEPALSEDEQIAETLRKRHTVVHPETEQATEDIVVDTPVESVKAPENNLLRQLVLLVILLAVTAYYLHDRGVLMPYVDVVKGYWVSVTGSPSEQTESMDLLEGSESDDLMSDDLFNQLMPVTDDLAALADSIATIPPESLYVVQELDTVQTNTAQEYLPVADEPIQLSDDDIIIINNRSMLLMVTELIGDIPDDIGTAHLFLKRDALTFTAIQGGDWVAAMKSTLDKFVLGSFDENYSTGNARISSKYEIIINAEQDFQPQILDEMRLLDVLAHPFNDYLQQIILDLPRGVNDNPAKFTFAGNFQEMQYVLSSWAETRTNFLLRSIDLEFQKNRLILSFDVIFFNYIP